VAGVKIIRGSDELMIITARGVIIRQDTQEISQQKRQTQGVTVIRLGEGDKVVGLARVIAEDGE